MNATLTPIAELVPLYIDGPAKITKRQAVRYIVDRRLHGDTWRGKGSRARRRAQGRNNFGREVVS